MSSCSGKSWAHPITNHQNKSEIASLSDIRHRSNHSQPSKKRSQRGTRRRFYQVEHACQWQVRELTYSSLNSPLRMAQSRLKTQNRPQFLSFSARHAPSALQTTRETPNDPLPRAEISHREHGEERQKGSEIPQHQRRLEQPERSEKTRSTQNEKSLHAIHGQKREISRHAQLP